MTQETPKFLRIKDPSAIPVPKLREDLKIQTKKGVDPGVNPQSSIYDPILCRNYRFSPMEMKIFQNLDGKRSFAQVAETVETPKGIQNPIRYLTGLIRFLEAMDLLEEKWIRRKLQQVKEYEAMRKKNDPSIIPRLVLKDSCFICVGCGACCCDYSLGPIEPHRVELVRGLNLGEKYPRLRGKDLFYRDTYGGKEEYYISKIDDRCVFLDPSGECVLHRDFGFREKPSVCRLFPHMPSNTLRGLVIGKQLECLNHWKTLAVSSDATDSIANLQDLLDQCALAPLIDTPVAIYGGAVVSFESYLLLEDVLMHLMALREYTVEELLMIMRDFLLDVLELLAEIPRSVYPNLKRFCRTWKERRDFPRPYQSQRIDERIFLTSVMAISERLIRALHKSLAYRGDETWHRAQYWDMTNATSMLETRVNFLLGVQELAPYEFYRSVEAVRFDVREKKLDDLYRYFFREYLFSKELVRQKTAASSFGFMVFGYILQKWEAKIRVAVEGGRRVDPREGNRAYATINRIIRHEQLHSSLEDSIDHLEEIFRHFSFYGSGL
jgi:Fe-S-cluster containining protein